jgi:ABC-type multidrug transport system fused ATPase/permease subunit
MARTCEFYHYIGLSAQLLTPILFYFALIASAHLVSSSLFHKLKKTLDYETLNRISGDIAAIDRTVTINLFEIIFTLALILSSYLYSIITLPLWWLQILLLLFLTACLSLAFKSNRFIMRSRREVARREL